MKTYFLKARTCDELLQSVFIMPLVANPGARAEYSDIGFILLGIALERLADESLDAFCQREIFAALGMTNTAFNPPSKLRTQIPPTVDDRSFRHRIVQGEVFDENASVLGGVAPHAGLFSTAVDLAQFANAMLNPGTLLRRETIVLFTHREAMPAGTSRALGWDTPSATLAVGKIFRHGILWPLGVHRNLSMDRSRPATLDHFTNQPHVARLLESCD